MKIVKRVIMIVLAGVMLISCAQSEQPNDGDTAGQEESSTYEQDAYLEAVGAYEQGDYLKAVEVCERAEKEGVEKVELDMFYKLWGASLYELGEHEEAMKYYDKALAVNNNNYQVWTNLGIIYRQMGDNQKAIECYEKSLEIEPNYAETHSSLGTIYIIEGDAKKAILSFEKAIDLDPTLAVAQGNMALALAMEDRFDEAHEALKQSRVLGYENADVIQERVDELSKAADKD